EAVMGDAGGLLHRWVEKTKDGNREFFDTDAFAWVKDVEARWMDVRAELDAAMPRIDDVLHFQDIPQMQRRITEDHRWKVFPFYAYGQRVDQNCARCPKTDALLRSIPGMTTGMFSILLPHKHIPARRGPWKGVPRHHLALRTPSDEKSCRIRVDDQVRSWECGKSLIFDDTYEHEVWNDTDDIRVVLFVDFIREL